MYFPLCRKGESHYAEPMASFQIQDYRFQFEKAGSASPALIFLHDGLLHAAGWQAQMDYFSQRRCCVAYDRRGYGANGSFDGQPYADQTDLLALLDHLKLDQVILCGASNGGRLALSFAVRFPERVVKLVLVGPALPGWKMNPHSESRIRYAMEPVKRGGNIPASIDRWVDDPYYIHPQNSAAKKFLRLALETHPHNIANMGQFRNRRDEEPPLEALKEIRKPVLILVGEADAPDAHARAGLAEYLLPSARRLILPETAHLPHLERPDIFNPALEEFLNTGAG